MRSRAWMHSRWSCALTAALLCSCTEEMTTERPAEPPPVVVRTDAASAAQCPSGGRVVSSGPDNNGNGALDDVEVATRTVVCMPAPTVPPGVVIRLVAEAPGVNCGAGGTAVQSGSDTNRNGKLDDGEVTQTEYACGQALLTRLLPEPEGANCTAGGVAFLAGRDRNADHMLDPGEVEVTEYDCGDALARDVDIRSSDDVAALASIRTITGSLSIRFADFEDVSLPRLEHVGGALMTFPFHMNRLSFPQLRDIDGVFELDGQIAAVDFPQLARVGSLSVRTGGLSDLSGLPSLTQVDGDVGIRGTFQMTAVDLSNLTIGGNLAVSSNTQLTEVTIAARDHVGSLTFSGNNALEAVKLSVAPSREPIAEMDSLFIFSNPKLARLALSADRINSLDVGGSPAIAEITLDVTRFDLEVLIFDITTPFKLALSAPRGGDQIELGHLTISSALETLVSTVPVAVDGLLVFDKTRLRSLDAGARIAAARGGVRFSDNARLTDIAPFMLGSSLQLINNARLASLPLLPLLDPNNFEFVVITDNPVLTSIPALAHLERARQGIDVARNAALGQLPLSALRWIDAELDVVDNPSLTSLALPVLEHVEFLAVERNAVLQTLEAPALVDIPGQTFIFNNQKLRHVVFDALTSAGLFDIASNPKLPSCEVLDIFSHVTGLCLQSGNDDTATCGS